MAEAIRTSEAAVAAALKSVASKQPQGSMLVSDEEYYCVPRPVQPGFSLDIPKRYQNAALSNFDGRDSEKIREAIEAIRRDESVFISGPPGTGKTHLACGLLRMWWTAHVADFNSTRAMDVRPTFLPAVELFARLKRTFDGGADETEQSILNDLTKRRLVVLDDVGAEKVSDWSRQVFYLLVDRRFREMRPTVITSNMSLEDVSKAIDDRIASRIVGSGVVVKLTGTDRRVPRK